MSKFETSFKKGYVPDWTIVEAVREYFQNAVDGEATDPLNMWGYAFDHTTGTLKITNRKSVLEADTLLLGDSEKAGDDKTIGSHGEGYKVASLVAVREGKEVIIYNYGKKEIWRPRISKSRKYNAEILVFETGKWITNDVPYNKLTIEVKGITPEEWIKIEASNLHIQDIEGDVHTTSKGRILMADRYKGKIYVNGLYVRTEPSMKAGYDILPQYLKLDRDRKMVSTWDLQWFTSQMWAEVKDDDVLLQVAKEGSGDARFTGYQSTTVFKETATTKAYEEFKQEHGEKAIPVTDQRQLKEVQEKYEDAKPVLVPETYQKMVEEAPTYKVKAKPKQPISMREKLLVWYGKIENDISYEQQKEFMDIMGIEEDNIPF